MRQNYKAFAFCDQINGATCSICLFYSEINYKILLFILPGQQLVFMEFNTFQKNVFIRMYVYRMKHQYQLLESLYHIMA